MNQDAEHLICHRMGASRSDAEANKCVVTPNAPSHPVQQGQQQDHPLPRLNCTFKFTAEDRRAIALYKKIGERLVAAGVLTAY
jgi:hypothetical protein